MSHATEERQDEAAREVAPWVERLARLGYAARGVVYALVGVLAVRAAFTWGDRPEGSEGALLALLRQPLGRVLLAAIAVGLVGYSLWRLVQVVLDPQGIGGDWIGRGKRAGLLISAVVHALLAWEAGRLAMGAGLGGRPGSDAEHWAAMAMSQPLGAVLVGGVALGIAAFGAYELYRAAAEPLGEKLNLTPLPGGRRPWVKRVARMGRGARGVMFLVIGYFVGQAALHATPGEARGLGGALRALGAQPHGDWLLGGVAVGLVAFGAYSITKARYRRIEIA